MDGVKFSKKAERSCVIGVSGVKLQNLASLAVY